MRFERVRDRHEGARIPVVARYGDPERQIIVKRHLRHQATTLKDLGARFGLSGESVRQMEMKALKAMRGMPTV
jgi:DNA-directed RNA polymerase sigma subunit (sigma70/sigma32)